MLNKLLNTEIKNANQLGEILNIPGLAIPGSPSKLRADEEGIKKEVKKLINDCDDLELIQKIAIKFDDYAITGAPIFDCEDKLIELMGEDEACDWMDDNDLS